MSNPSSFRADHVGSLLRPASLKEARLRHARGEIDAAALRAVEDREIVRAIRLQEAAGLQGISDGEMRRAWWHLDFLAGFSGAETYDMGHGQAFHGTETKPLGVRVTGRLGFAGHPMIEHFRFLAAHTDRTPKMTIPSPTAMHYRRGREAISTAVYPDLAPFFADLGAAYRQAVRGFYDAGCRYLQLDEVYLALLCDPEQHRFLRARGDDPDALLESYADLINQAIAGVPADMTIAMHLCRGNFRSTYMASGGYEPIADLLFNRLGIQRYFLEYDSDRAGGFEPLRFLPKGKTAVLGIVTSKSGQLESKEAIERRIEQAAKYADIAQLGLSPQCGFASTEEGNLLSEDEQWAKLRRVVEVAAAVWP